MGQVCCRQTELTSLITTQTHHNARDKNWNRKWQSNFTFISFNKSKKHCTSVFHFSNRFVLCHSLRFQTTMALNFSLPAAFSSHSLIVSFCVCVSVCVCVRACVFNSGRGIGLLYRRLNFGRAAQIRQNLKLLFVCYKKKGKKRFEMLLNQFRDSLIKLNKKGDNQI